MSAFKRVSGDRREPNIVLGISLHTMSSRRDPKEKVNRHTRTKPGECDPVPEHQQQLETDLSSGAPPTRRGIADHTNPDWIVIEPDPSYIPRPGSGHDHIIRPWQVNAVVGALADRVDEVIAQVRNLGEPPREGVFQNYSRQPGLGSGHHCETVNRATVPSDTRAAADLSRSRGSHGKSASARQDLVDRECGISLDGFPSRSMEEGGVGGLCQGEGSHASDGAAKAGPSSSSSSCASAGSSAMPMDGAIIHTARTVTLHPVRANYPYDGEIAVHRPPLPAELDRIDERLNDALRFTTDFSPGTVAPAQASDEDTDLMLTGGRESIITLPNRDQVSEGRLDPPLLPEPLRIQRKPPLAGKPDGHAAGVGYVQSRPASPAPSESSITATVFNVRRPTPPPPPPPQADIVSLPSSRRHVNPAEGQSGGGRRGGACSSSGVGQEEAVPAVLVPGGWLGLGGRHPRLQVSRRQGRDDPDGEEEELRRRKEGEE